MNIEPESIKEMLSMKNTFHDHSIHNNCEGEVKEGDDKVNVLK